MNKIKVLIIDDSLVVRHLVSEILNENSEVEVVGTASNGKVGLEKLPQLNPDLVILDIEMPEMDGLQTLPHIRKTHPRLPIIMCSTLTQKGAEATFKALSLGATDYVAKPSNTASLANSKDGLKNDLLPKVIALGSKSRDQKNATGAAAAVKPAALAHQSTSPNFPVVKIQSLTKIEILAIGVSTGGPNALEKLLSGIPKNFPVPIVIVQHMPPTFTKMLAEHLNTKCALEVREAQAGEKLSPGGVWLAPGGSHMILSQSGGVIQTALNMDPAENSCRPSVDVLFRSVNQIYGSKTLAVIMTGMGSDGLKSCEQIHAAGGKILAQDEASSVVWGMPGFIAKAGIAEAVLPLDKLAEEIVRRAYYNRGIFPDYSANQSGAVAGGGHK